MLDFNTNGTQWYPSTPMEPINFTRSLIPQWVQLLPESMLGQQNRWIFHIPIHDQQNKSSTINQLSIRKLEFEAATLGAELASSCESKMTTTIASKNFWTDSTTKLGWIQSKQRQKMYIANSLSKIHENSNPGVWKNSRKYEFRWPRHTRPYPITHTKAMASTTGPSEHTSRLLVFYRWQWSPHMRYTSDTSSDAGHWSWRIFNMESTTELY